MMRARRHRNQLLTTLLACAVVLPLAHAARAADREPKVDAAVNAAVECLVKQQSDDGSFRLAAPPRVSDTAAALLAMLSAGNVQDVGRDGLVVRRAVDSLVNLAPDDGNFGRLDGSGVRGQSIAIIALAEAFAVEPDPQVRARIRVILNRATGVILRTQILPAAKDSPGGWPATAPAQGDAELISTAWSLLALRAARNIGVEIPQANIDRGLAFVTSCLVRGGEFADQPGRSGSFASTAAAASAIWLLQTKDASQIPASAAAVLQKPTAQDAVAPFTAIFFAAEAAMNISQAAWPGAWATYRDAILAKQDPDGGWPAADPAAPNGRIQSTSMAILTLTRPDRLLITFEK
jgi:hypothetical protein